MVTLALPISYRYHVPLRVRRRPRRPSGLPISAVLALAVLAAAVVLTDRACGYLAVARAGSTTASAAPAPVPAAAALSPGACATLGAIGSSRGRTIFVDAGHGGPDPGVTARSASGQMLKEATETLAVARDLSGVLRADGYRVVLSRTADSSVLRFSPDQLDHGGMTQPQVLADLEARIRCADASHADALLSIHFNGYSDPTVGGTQTFYDGVRAFAAESKRLAGDLQSALVSRLGRPDRGAVTDDQLQAPTMSDRAGSYGHLVLLGPAQPGWLAQPTAMPGALVEPLFLTRPDEAAIASSPAGQRRIAAALAGGLEAYLAGH